MKKKSGGMEVDRVPPAKINPNPKLPKAFKGKALRGPKAGRSAARPAGGGKKGY